MTRGLFTVAHAVKGEQNPFGVQVYRAHQRASLKRALTKAIQISRAGYLVWVEHSGSRATRR